MRDAMSAPKQRALADALKRVLSEAELADLKVLIAAASQWADALINQMAPVSEQSRNFERAYAERDEALDIGNALNRFDAL